MRIAIDLQGIQSDGSRTRGIGRYSKEIVRAIIEQPSENEYVLVANASLRDVSEDFLPQLEKYNNLNYLKWSSPGPLDYLSKNDTAALVAKYLRSYAFSRLNVDLILITSFLEGFTENCILDFDNDFLKVPILSIFYDAIPLINPKLYLHHNPDFESFYLDKLKKIKDLDGLLAISHSSYKEAINYLNFDSKCVYNISSACDQEVFNTKKLIELNSNISFNSITPYILYSGASDPRKNVKRLIHAYSLISSELSSKYNLVLVGKLVNAEINLIKQWIEKFNIDSENVHILGYVSDSDLALLYRKCSLFVFPSLHEGFGLPVLEAMSCGAPVIGSNATSIPEIIGTSEALFDPNSVISIKNLIEKGLTDISFRTFLVNNAKDRSQLFSWSDSAARAIEAFETFVNKYIQENTSDDLSILRQNNFNLLLKKISEISSIKYTDKCQFLEQICASIDLIDRGLDLIFLPILSRKSKLSWKVEGPFDSNYSLAILNRYFFTALKKKSIDVTFKITEGFGDYQPDIDFLRQYPDLYNCYNDQNTLGNRTDIVSRNLYPPRVSDLNAKINLIHSYGWEESEFPIEWVHDFNSNLNGISVMSNFVKKILIDNGVKIPIYVSGLGLDHIEDIQSSDDFRFDAKKYKILHVSSCFPRKSIDILIKAYENNFTNKDDVSLIIKTFENQHNNIDQILNEHRRKNKSFPDVIVIKKDLNNNQMRSLFLKSDVLVAPSKGEGFGLPIGEAMSLGIPVITTAWGGQLDFCNINNSWLIDYEFTYSHTHFDLDMSFWAEPSLSHLSSLIYTLFKATKEEISQKTEIAKKEIAKFNWDNVASNNLFFANTIINSNFQKNTKIGWVTTWNSRCGIASYSKHLIDHIEGDLVVFNPRHEDSMEDYDFDVRPTWELESISNQQFDLLFSEILKLKITTLVIQFNYGFFDFEQLSNLLEKLSRKDIKIIIFMHSTVDPDNALKKLDLLLSSLSKCSRILVHTIADLNRLKSYGLIENVSLFPHGFLDFEDDRQTNSFLSKINFFRTNKIPKIATYGFCLPNKGFAQLIEAVKILKDKQFPVKLNLFTAIYNDDYYYVYEELVDLIKELDVSELVSINNDYLSDEDSLKHLSKSDLIVFPYQNSNESSSASVRHGLSTYKPVFVTPSKIFHDISDCVYHLPGYTSTDIANGLINWFSDDKNLRNNIHEKIIKNKKIIKNRSFARLGYRLSSMIRSLELNDA